MNGLSDAKLVPGRGLVAHVATLLCVCAETEAAEGLLALVREVARSGGDGAALVNRVAALIAAEGPGGLPACAVAGPTAGGAVAVLVYGGAEAEVVVGDRPEHLTSAAGAVTGAHAVIYGPVRSVRLALPGAGPADRRTRLDAGVVPGAGILLLPESVLQAVPEPAAQPMAHPASEPMAHPASEPMAQPMADLTPQAMGQGEPDPPTVPRLAPVESSLSKPVQIGMREPDRAVPFDSVLLVVDAGAVPPGDRPGPAGHEPGPAGHEPGPAGPGPAAPGPAAAESSGSGAPHDSRALVRGVSCKNGHFNDPRVPYCGICGIGMLQQTAVGRLGPRPPLGVIMLDDGATFRLDADYVLGREPESDPEVASGAVRPLRVSGDVISRRHVRVTLHNWDVRILDLGSANGTYIRPPGYPNSQRLTPGVPQVILPGTQVSIGNRRLRYESYRNP